MGAKLSHRPWRRILAVTAVAVFVTAAYVVAQTGEFFAKGTLEPFSDPTDAGKNLQVVAFRSDLVPGQPGQASGWHWHSGDVYQMVVQGTLTEQLADCTTHNYPAGTVAHTPATVTHRVINLGNSNTLFVVFQVYPKDEKFNYPAPDPGCSIGGQ